MARLVLGAAGAVVGFFVTGGNPIGALQGFTIGYAVGGLLEPNRKVSASKLTDLKAPAASLGAPIIYLEGGLRVPGVYAWSSDKIPIEHTSSQGGKGGPGVDSSFNTYEINLLIAISTNRCQALRRVWSNGNLVWNNGSDADAETITASATTNSWRDIRFYDGNEDQMPDPVYEAAVGVGNAPAYLDRTMIFIEGLNLGQSGQLPVLTFEVLSEASNGLVVTQDSEVEGGARFTNGTPAFTADGYVVPVGQWQNTYLNDTIEWWSVMPAGTAPLLVATTSAGYSYIGSVQNPMRGQSDIPCFVNTHVSNVLIEPGFIRFQTQDGFVREFHREDTTERSAVLVFAKRGNLFVTAPYIADDSDGVDPRALRVYDFSTQLLVLTTDDIGTEVWDIAISLDETKLYAVSEGINPINFYEFDATTGDLLRSFPIPEFTVNNCRVMVDSEDGTVYAVGNSATNPGGEIRKLVGSSFELFSAGAGGATGIAELAVDSYYSSLGVADGIFYTLAGDAAGDHEVWRGTFQTDAVDVTLDQVVRRLCLRTGLLTDDDIDVTDLEGIIVHGFAVTQVSTSRASLEILMGWYLFEAVEGWVIRFVLRGGPSVATIPYEDLAAGPNGSDEPLPMVRRNDIESPARYSVKYANIDNDYQDGLERADRLVTESTAEAVIEFAIGGTPSEAAKVADSNTLDAAVGLLQIGPIALTRKYARLEPTDVVTVTDAYGDTFRTRIVKGAIGAGLYKYDLLLDDATVVNSAAETDEDYSSSSLIRLAASTDLDELDIPLLRDADNGPGFYVRVTASSSNWPGAEIDKSPDDVNYSKILDVSDLAIAGTATTILPDFSGGNVFDEESSVTVDVAETGALSSTTRDSMLVGDVNAFLIGSEIIQARDATYVSPGVYTLTGLRRGLRGTEWAMAGHAASERAVLLKLGSGIRRVSENGSEIGVPFFYKAVTYGKSRASVLGESFTDTGIGLKPFAVVDIRADWSTDPLEFSWHRRSRLSSRFLAQVDPPLAEATESYDYELRDGSDVLQDSGNVTTPSYTATGFSPGSLFGWTLTIWQRSEVVGRGYPASFVIALVELHRMTPGAGAVVITGLAPVAGRTSIVQPGAGSITIAGRAPSLNNNQIVQPGAGSITVAGLAPAAFGGVTAAPGAGAVVISGQAPTAVVSAAVTWDPAFKGTTLTLSGGNLTASSTSATSGTTRSTTSKSSGSWYFEILVNTVGNATGGVCNGTYGANSTQTGDNANSWGLLQSGSKYHSGTPSGPITASFTNGSVICVAYDASAGKVWFGVNNSFSGNPAAGTGEAYSGVTGPIWACVSPSSAVSSSLTGRFKTADFSYSPPSGFSAWE